MAVQQEYVPLRRCAAPETRWCAVPEVMLWVMVWSDLASATVRTSNRSLLEDLLPSFKAKKD